MLFALAWLGCGNEVAIATECAGEYERAQIASRKIRKEWPLRSGDEVGDLVRSVVERLASAHRPRSWEIVVVRNRNRSS